MCESKAEKGLSHETKCTSCKDAQLAERKLLLCSPLARGSEKGCESVQKGVCDGNTEKGKDFTGACLFFRRYDDGLPSGAHQKGSFRIVW